MSSHIRSGGSGEVHSLYAFALRAIGDAVLAGAIADTGALAVLPAEAAEALLDDLAQQLATNDGPSPPLELLPQRPRLRPPAAAQTPGLTLRCGSSGGASTGTPT